jgi:hypothetical protein
MRNRIHISGGESVAFAGVQRRDPGATAAMLASLGVRTDYSLPRWGGQTRVGVDMTSLPNSDGSLTKVEWLPLSPVAGYDITFGATRDFELKPTKYARPSALVMADTLAVNLAMTNLLIGGKPLFAGSGAVPCVLFSHLSVQNALSSYVASNAAPITFTLQNIHASVTQTVRGVWVCDTQELAV